MAVEAVQAGRFRWDRAVGEDHALRLVWDRFGVSEAPELRVAISVRLQADWPLSEWRITVERVEGIGVDSVRFPCLSGILPLGPGEESAVPRLMGQLAQAPRRLLAEFERS